MSMVISNNRHSPMYQLSPWYMWSDGIASQKNNPPAVFRSCRGSMKWFGRERILEK
jgi:hypothetical protein